VVVSLLLSHCFLSDQKRMMQWLADVTDDKERRKE
jgi:hypothetical protein